MLSLSGSTAPPVQTASLSAAEKKTPEKRVSTTKGGHSQPVPVASPPNTRVDEVALTGSADPRFAVPQSDAVDVAPAVLNVVEADPAKSKDAGLVSAEAPDALNLPLPWPEFAAQLALSGMAAQLARQSELVRIQGRTLWLRVPTRALSEGQHTERLKTLLVEQLGSPLMLEFEVGEAQGDSAHARDVAKQQARLHAAERAVEQDPFVKSLLRDFDGRVVPGSIQPGPSLQ